MSEKQKQPDKQALRITKRDIDFFHDLAKLKMLTARQIAALHFVKPAREQWDADAAKSAAAKRIAALVRNDYLIASYIPGTHGEKCYLLGPAAIQTLKLDTGFVDFRSPRYLERTRTDAIYMALHDIPINSMVINMMLLERLRDDFQIYDIQGERDCRFKVKTKNLSPDYRPDCYVLAGVGSEYRRACFFEMDTGAVDGTRLQAKIYLHLQFVYQRLKEDLGIKVDPVMCFLVPDKSRLRFVAQQINKTKRGSMRDVQWVRDFPFFLATHDDMDLGSVEKGYVSDNLIRNEHWYDDTGTVTLSPFIYEEVDYRE